MIRNRRDEELAREYLGEGIDRARADLEDAGGDSRAILYDSIIDLWDDARTLRATDPVAVDVVAFAALRAARRIAAGVDSALVELHVPDTAQDRAAQGCESESTKGGERK